MQCTLNTRRKLGGGILLALTRIRCLVVVESALEIQMDPNCHDIHLNDHLEA